MPEFSGRTPQGREYGPDYNGGEFFSNNCICCGEPIVPPPDYFCNGVRAPVGWQVEIEHTIPDVPTLAYMCPQAAPPDNCIWDTGPLANSWQLDFNWPNAADATASKISFRARYVAGGVQGDFITVGWGGNTDPGGLAFRYNLPLGASWEYGVPMTATLYDPLPTPYMGVGVQTTFFNNTAPDTAQDNYLTKNTAANWHLWQGPHPYQFANIDNWEKYARLKNFCEWENIGGNPGALISGDDPDCVACSLFDPQNINITESRFLMYQSPAYDGVVPLPATITMTPVGGPEGGFDPEAPTIQCTAGAETSCDDGGLLWTTARAETVVSNARTPTSYVWVPPAGSCGSPCELVPYNRTHNYLNFPPSNGRTWPADCRDITNVVGGSEATMTGEEFDAMLEAEGLGGCVGCGG